MKEKIFKRIVLLVVIMVTMFANINSIAYAADSKQGVDVILVIDKSGSMGLDHRDPEKRALNMADFFVRNLPDDDLRLGVYSFSTDIQEVFTFGEVSAEKSDKVKIHNAIKNLEYKGDTDMGDAFETCAGIWETIKSDSSSRKQIIVFMTDGEISFGNDKTPEDIDAINDSRERMNKALDLIDCTTCPVYVIAFGDDAVEGKDAKDVASREGNRFIPARDQKTLLEAYNNVFENILGTKKTETTGVVIDKNHSIIPLNNDDKQTGLNVNITRNESGTGKVIDDIITLVNEKTGQTWTSEEFEDYFDEYLGRLLKIPEDILKTGDISLVMDSSESDIVDVKEYYIYDISCTWDNENGATFEKGQEITFKINIEGIDTNSFIVYAIFEKDGKKVKQVLPNKIYSGQQADNVTIYGSSLDEDKLESFSGIKMLLDTEDNSYQTTVTFEELGDYSVHIYGESEKGFTQSEKLEFSITKPTEHSNNDSKSNLKEKLMNILHMLWEMFMALPLWGKVIAVLAVFIALRIVVGILSFIFYRDDDDDDDDDDDY